MKIKELKELLEALPAAAENWEATFRYENWNANGGVYPSHVETPVLGLELRAGRTAIVLIGAGQYETWEKEQAGLK